MAGLVCACACVCMCMTCTKIVFVHVQTHRTDAKRSKQNQHVIGGRKAKDQRYAFDIVFNDKSTQKSVYESTGKPCVREMFNGYNATVFAYGATG